MAFITMAVTTIFWIIIIIISVAVHFKLKRRRFSQNVHPVEGYEMGASNREQATETERYVDFERIRTSTQGPNSTSSDSVSDSQRVPTSQASTQEPVPPEFDSQTSVPEDHTIANSAAEGEERVSGSAESKDSIFSKEEIKGSAEAGDSDNTNEGEKTRPRTKSRSLSTTSHRKESSHPVELEKLIHSS